MKNYLIHFCYFCTLLACSPSSEIQQSSLLSTISTLESIPGKTAYLESPYVAAGDRVYAVGHQDGSFPDLGWHVSGEMGGIWDHPIKLMDGFTLGISNGDDFWCLTAAEQFINYPVANRHEFALGENLAATRVQFVPDGVEGLVVEYTIRNFRTKSKKLTLEFTGMIDLTPVWLSERLELVDGKDLVEYDENMEVWIARDSINDWFTIFGADREITKWQKSRSDCSYSRKGRGTDATITYETRVRPEGTETVRYFIAGSYQSKEAAIKTYKQLRNQYRELLEEKINRYESIKQTADLHIPDKNLQELYTWTKYNTDWLVRDVPEQGRGLSAGIPDYPWWFGTDNTYALQGWLATGQHAEVKATIELILKLSAGDNSGRIMHETSTNGRVFNPGNLNTTPYFIHLLWKYYEWTGDRELLKSVYPVVKKGLEWLESQDVDGNGYPDGAGMMEIRGLHSEMIDVVAYTQAAYTAAAKMAAELDDQVKYFEYNDQAKELHDKINKEWWVAPANSFADFRASRVKTLQLIDEAIVRADTLDKPWAVEELNQIKARIGRLRDNRVQGHVVHHNWVVNTPLELGIATEEHAEKALETARKYTNRFGMYVTGIDRDDTLEASAKWKAFSYVGAVMTLPTGVQAIAEARYGHPDRALKYLENLENSFSYALPGSMYEVSPDYGMIAQAWNIYAVATPVIEHFFGVQPAAHKKEIRLAPMLPSGWEEAKLSNLKVGNNTVTFEKTKTGYLIEQSQENWKIKLVIPDSGGARKVLVNGKPSTVEPDEGGEVILILSGKRNEVVL